MSDTQFPEDRRYTKEHEWAKLEQDSITVGITAFAVEQLGDVTLVDLPSVGSSIKAGERFGDIESVKTVSELFSPVDGEVIEVNEALADKPELINDDTYGQGWMLRIRISDQSQLEELMDAASYATFVAEQD
ncbi:MAG: glycine cleavage system protein GcvH [Myxococcales bacterium]|nr:MAG: glycine cleavage system protein GcvH [Myxococcales bacterium]